MLLIKIYIKTQNHLNYKKSLDNSTYATLVIYDCLLQNIYPVIQFPNRM